MQKKIITGNTSTARFFPSINTAKSLRTRPYETHTLSFNVFRLQKCQSSYPSSSSWSIFYGDNASRWHVPQTSFALALARLIVVLWSNAVVVVKENCGFRQSSRGSSAVLRTGRPVLFFFLLVSFVIRSNYIDTETMVPQIKERKYRNVVNDLCGYLRQPLNEELLVFYFVRNRYVKITYIKKYVSFRRYLNDFRPPYRSRRYFVVVVVVSTLKTRENVLYENCLIFIDNKGTLDRPRLSNIKDLHLPCDIYVEGSSLKRSLELI